MDAELYHTFISKSLRGTQPQKHIKAHIAVHYDSGSNSVCLDSTHVSVQGLSHHRDLSGVEKQKQLFFPCLQIHNVLVSFSVAIIKHSDKSKLREEGFSLSHSSRENSS